jgi:hypothetical protein
MSTRSEKFVRANKLRIDRENGRLKLPSGKTEPFKLDHGFLLAYFGTLSLPETSADRIQEVIDAIEVAVSDHYTDLTGGAAPDEIFIFELLPDQIKIFGGNREKMRLALLKERWIEEKSFENGMLCVPAMTGHIWLVISWGSRWTDPTTTVLMPLYRQEVPQ